MPFFRKKFRFLLTFCKFFKIFQDFSKLIKKLHFFFVFLNHRKKRQKNPLKYSKKTMAFMWKILKKMYHILWKKYF
jgi:hypothetical protein